MSYLDALRASEALQRLAMFDPHVAGTLPLRVSVEGSDIDILCHAPDLDGFAQVVWRHFAQQQDFSLHQWARDGRAVIARFEAHGWPFEIFGSSQPVHEQAGWRHFEVERRLLDLGGEDMRVAVLALRQNGTKTEPAFARVLGLQGDPYAAMLDLGGRTDAELLETIRLRRC